jgi:hypothetical protein
VDEFLIELESRPKSCAGKIMDLLATQSKEFNEKIIRTFEIMAKKLQENTKTVDELVALQQCLQQAKSTDLQMLEDNIDISRKR